MLDFYTLHYSNCSVEVIVKAKKDKVYEIKTNAKITSKKKVMYLHSAELNVVAVTENVNTFLLV